MAKWYEKAIFYHIYPLGCLGAPVENDRSSGVNPRLAQLGTWIPYLQQLGVTALYLGPLFESGTHGYDTIDYYTVDRRLGTNDDLKRFVVQCHDAGIRVVLDAVFNHVGRGHPAFEDLRTHGWNSHYRSWFFTDFGRQSSYGDRFWYEGWNGHYNLVKLNLREPRVEAYLHEVVRFWIHEFAIDGLRFDAADAMDKQFFNGMRRCCKEVKDDFWLMGEVIHGNYREWASPERCDSVTNYEGLWSSHNDRNYFEIAYSINRQYGEGGIYRGIPLYNFADNHDVDRVASQLNDPAHLFPLYLLLFTMPGVPSLYYGSEWGMTGKKDTRSDLPLRPYIAIETARDEARKSPLFKVIRTLIAIRKSLAPLRRGDYATLLTDSEQYCFMRRSADETVVVGVNAEAGPVTKSVRIPVPDGTVFFDVLNDRERFVVSHGCLTMPLFPRWGRILVRNG